MNALRKAVWGAGVAVFLGVYLLLQYAYGTDESVLFQWLLILVSLVCGALVTLGLALVVVSVDPKRL